MNRIATRLPAEVPAQPAFVVFALPAVMAAYQVAEVYRLAAERTRQQLAPRRPAGVPTFSCN